MILFTPKQEQKLLENGRNPDKDHPPVARIYIPGTGCHWLLSELNPEQENIAFGLCDLGMGFPELGYVDVNEILESAPILLISVARFEGRYPLSVYAEAAREASAITFDDEILQRHYNARSLMHN